MSKEKMLQEIERAQIVINQNNKYAEKLPEIIFGDMSKIFEF